jgi:hypothetical protein
MQQEKARMSPVPEFTSRLRLAARGSLPDKVTQADPGPL